MPDPRFFSNAGPFELGVLADFIGAEINGPHGADYSIEDVAPLQNAARSHVSFFDNKLYKDSFDSTSAGACIVGPGIESDDAKDISLLVVEDPYRAYAQVAKKFYPEIDDPEEVTQKENIHPTAVLGPGVTVGPGAVIGPRAEIGANTRVGPAAVIGAAVRLGEDCVVGPCASVRFCLGDNRIRIGAGARIGEDGFGYASSAEGHIKVPQLGRVIINDDVEIGANTTIDRGSGPDTVIGAGTVIDNLVQIAHNVKIGRNCILVAQVGISGSATLGDFVVIGGQGGVTGHLTIGAGARVAAKSGVMTDIPAGAAFVGAPAMPQRTFWRQMAALKILASKTSDN